MTDQRQHVRFTFEQDVELAIGESNQPGKTVNISRGGVFVTTAPVPEFRTRLVLLMQLPGVPDPSAIPCVVRWSKAGEGIGLQFEQLRPIEVWALGKLLRDLEQ